MRHAEPSRGAHNVAREALVGVRIEASRQPLDRTEAPQARLRDSADLARPASACRAPPRGDVVQRIGGGLDEQHPQSGVACEAARPSGAGCAARPRPSAPETSRRDRSSSTRSPSNGLAVDGLGAVRLRPEGELSALQIARSASPSSSRAWGSSARERMCAAADETDPGANRDRGSSVPSISACPPASAATTGSPAAIASRTVRPKCSNGAVATSRPASAIRAGTSRRNPRNRTLRATPSSAASVSSDARSGPSPAISSRPAQPRDSRRGERTGWRCGSPSRAVDAVRRARGSLRFVITAGAAGSTPGYTTVEGTSTNAATARLMDTSASMRRSTTRYVIPGPNDPRGCAKCRVETIAGSAADCRARRDDGDIRRGHVRVHDIRCRHRTPDRGEERGRRGRRTPRDARLREWIRHVFRRRRRARSRSARPVPGGWRGDARTARRRRTAPS